MGEKLNLSSKGIRLGIQNLLYELKSFLIAICRDCKSQGTSKRVIKSKRETPSLPRKPAEREIRAGQMNATGGPCVRESIAQHKWEEKEDKKMKIKWQQI